MQAAEGLQSFYSCAEIARLLRVSYPIVRRALLSLPERPARYAGRLLIPRVWLPQIRAEVEARRARRVGAWSEAGRRGRGST